MRYRAVTRFRGRGISPIEMYGINTEVYSRVSSGVSVFFPTGCKRLYKRHRIHTIMNNKLLSSITLSLMFVQNNGRLCSGSGSMFDLAELFSRERFTHLLSTTIVLYTHISSIAIHTRNHIVVEVCK